MLRDRLVPAWLGGGTVSLADLPTWSLVLPFGIVATALMVKRLRTLLLTSLSRIYLFFFHRPFRNDPKAFLIYSHGHPLPATSSFWSASRARSILTQLARSRGFHDVSSLKRDGIRHERDIDWAEPGVPQKGDLIESWDRIAEWDEQCIHPEKLQAFRTLSDTLADEAFEQVTRSQRDANDTDALGQIYRLAVDREADGSACATFWNAVNRRPPPGAGALGLEWYAKRNRRRGRSSQTYARWPLHPATNQAQEPDFVAWRPERDGSTGADPGETEHLDDNGEELLTEREVLRRGQDVFYKYAGPMLLSLLHFSLAGGFASPRITEVLRQTAYLVPGTHKRREKAANGSQSTDAAKQDAGGNSANPNGDLPQVDKARADRTWTRLLETTQFVLDVMESVDDLKPPCLAAAAATEEIVDRGTSDELPALGGRGWQSATRVRLLHTAVRQRVLGFASRGTSPTGLAYDVAKNGVPINQEDLLATLCSFSVAPLASLQAMGILPSAQEREDFIALWRHIGFYMGIEPAILRTCFSDAATADRTLWCAILHLFGQVEVTSGGGDGDSEEAAGSSGGKDAGAAATRKIQGPTIPVLIACADRPPFHTPLSAHFAISRHLLGPSLSDSLGIPATDPLRAVITDLAFLGMRIPIWFGQLYRRSWERKRRDLARPLLRRLIVWSMGNKVSRFEMPPRGTKSDKDTGTVEGNVPTQSKKLIDVEENQADNLRLVKEWRWVMRELIGICASFAAAAILGPALVARHLYL